jgi:mRNA interferase HigB
MKIIGRDKLMEFIRSHADSRGQIQSWILEVESADWRTPQDVRLRYPSADVLAGNRIIFNVKGNHYRLVVKISYNTKIVVIDRIGTHAEYSKWTL